MLWGVEHAEHGDLAPRCLRFEDAVDRPWNLKRYGLRQPHRTFGHVGILEIARGHVSSRDADGHVSVGRSVEMRAEHGRAHGGKTHYSRSLVSGRRGELFAQMHDQRF